MVQVSLASAAILDAVVSHAMASGLFETVNAHEPKSAPGTGLVASVWVESIAPARRASGLSSTTALVVLLVRVQENMLAEPQDFIDVQVMGAVDTLMNAYSGDFTLGGLVRNVDLLAQSGTALSARAGYGEQDKRMYRVMDITLPLIVNDVWSQSP